MNRLHNRENVEVGESLQVVRMDYLSMFYAKNAPWELWTETAVGVEHEPVRCISNGMCSDGVSPLQRSPGKLYQLILAERWDTSRLLRVSIRLKQPRSTGAQSTICEVLRPVDGEVRCDLSRTVKVSPELAWTVKEEAYADRKLARFSQVDERIDPVRVDVHIVHLGDPMLQTELSSESIPVAILLAGSRWHPLLHPFDRPLHHQTTEMTLTIAQDLTALCVVYTTEQTTLLDCRAVAPDGMGVDPVEGDGTGAKLLVEGFKGDLILIWPLSLVPPKAEQPAISLVIAVVFRCKSSGPLKHLRSGTGTNEIDTTRHLTRSDKMAVRVNQTG